MNILEQITGGLLIYLLIFLLGTIVIKFIIGVWKRNDLSQASKIMWMLFFVFAPVFSIICCLGINKAKIVIFLPERTGGNRVYAEFLTMSQPLTTYNS